MAVQAQRGNTHLWKELEMPWEKIPKKLINIGQKTEKHQLFPQFYTLK